MSIIKVNRDKEGKVSSVTLSVSQAKKAVTKQAAQAAPAMEAVQGKAGKGFSAFMAGAKAAVAAGKEAATKELSKGTAE